MGRTFLIEDIKQGNHNRTIINGQAPLQSQQLGQESVAPIISLWSNLNSYIFIFELASF